MAKKNYNAARKYQQQQQQQSSYYDQQPPQPTVIYLPAEAEFKIESYKPILVGLPTTALSALIVAESKGMLVLAGFLGMFWEGCMWWRARRRWMSHWWSVGLVVLTFLTAASVVVAFFLDFPDLIEDSYSAIFFAVLVMNGPQLVASLMTFYDK